MRKKEEKINKKSKEGTEKAILFYFIFIYCICFCCNAVSFLCFCCNVGKDCFKLIRVVE
jgi:hypothetical protein